MNFWSTKERRYPEDAKTTAIIIGGLITMVSIVMYTAVTITCINAKGCLYG